MLTADLAQSWVRGGKTAPRYVDVEDAEYRADAEKLIAIFAASEGRTHAELDEALDAHVGLGVDYKIQRGLIKLLTDRCEFETISAKDPVEIRRALFLQAGRHHPIVEDGETRVAVVRVAALELECEPAALVAGMYADLPEQQRLMKFEPLSAAELLDLYNVAQAQALLYRCAEMRLWIEPQNPEAYRELFGAIKAYRLIHTIKGGAREGYEIRLDGPVSMFHRSQKYGVQMAVFLPALLLCHGWRMRAEISAKLNGSGTRNAVFELDSRQRQLRSHYLSIPPYENPVREKLINSWEKTDRAWALEESSTVIDLGDAAFIPDFVLRHEDGREVYLEIFGFWTPGYLHDRLREFAHAGLKNFVIAAWDELRGSREPLARTPGQTIIFKTRLDPAELEAMCEKVSAG
jgi:predicted nuclease of restriction endonuclease-like RecB superfamily